MIMAGYVSTRASLLWALPCCRRLMSVLLLHLPLGEGICLCSCTLAKHLQVCTDEDKIIGPFYTKAVPLL